MNICIYVCMCAALSTLSKLYTPLRYLRSLRYLRYVFSHCFACAMWSNADSICACTLRHKTACTPQIDVGAAPQESTTMTLQPPHPRIDLCSDLALSLQPGIVRVLQGGHLYLQLGDCQSQFRGIPIMFQLELHVTLAEPLFYHRLPVVGLQNSLP